MGEPRLQSLSRRSPILSMALGPFWGFTYKRRHRVPACRQTNFPGAQVERADDVRKFSDHVGSPVETVADGRLK